MSFFDKFQNRILKIFLIIFLVILFLIGAIYAINVGSEWFDRKEFRDNFEKLYSGSDDEKNSQDLGLKSYLGFSDSELSAMTSQEKIIAATQTATKLVVYDFDFNIKSQVDLEDFCIYLDEFSFNDNFDMFTLDPKWRNFYALSVFSRDKYDISYKSNIYLKDNYKFPLQYYEDHKKTYTVYDQSLISGNLVDQNVRFEDKMQLVLKDSNSDQVPDDVDLVLKVEVIADKNDGAEELQRAWNIPMTIRNGRVQVDEPSISCLTY